jgi:hypothetical protein
MAVSGSQSGTPLEIPPTAAEIGRRLQSRWHESGRKPGVLVADNGDVLIVRADGIRSRVGGVWRSGNGFTSSQLRSMHRPATRFEWVRWQNEALRMLPPHGDLARTLAVARAELPHGIVRRSVEGDVYLRTFQFEASLVRGRWYLGNGFTTEDRNAMHRISDRAERAALVIIARAALGVTRRNATFA